VRLRVAGLTGPSGGSTRGIFYEDPSLGRPWPSIACGLRAILVNALSLLRLVDVYHVGAVTKRLHVPPYPCRYCIFIQSCYKVCCPPPLFGHVMALCPALSA
jgi:hypothetical protein